MLPFFEKRSGAIDSTKRPLWSIMPASAKETIASIMPLPQIPIAFILTNSKFGSSDQASQPITL